MTKKNLKFTAGTGLVAGLIWTAILVRLGTLNSLNLGNLIWVLAPITLIGYLVALYVGDVLSKWKAVFNSLVRFVLVGFLNTGLDLGIFNLLIYFTGVEKGSELGWFKATSFAVAVISSYMLNKFWTFEAGSSGNRGSEFLKYITVTLIGFGINVGLTSAIANHVSPVLGFSQLQWDSVAAIGATCVSLIWNFVGYRLIVFKTVRTQSS